MNRRNKPLPRWKAAYQRVLASREVMKCTGLGFDEINTLCARGEFPSPVVLGQSCMGWDEDEIQDWILNRLERSHS